MIGTVLGHYEILEPLGEGGMGKVYRARDSRLKRDVALKVLPSELAHDAERLARLRREAELLASCNHPNIAAIYGVEEAGGSLVLVLELVNGKTLGERLASRRFSLEEALSVARQVASAVELAHRRGIVHRDLKPSNVMLDESGTVKVLDFGLAKPFDADPTTLASEAPTQETPLTAEGSLVGTLPYMSPEQLRGEAVDNRTDIWAFGCLLFELLSGKRPFQRTSPADTAAAIVEQEPDWAALPQTTPTAIRRLVERCLRKDPRSRLHHAADARIEIEEAPVVETKTASKRSRVSLAWMLATTGLLAVAVAFLLEESPSQARSPVRFSVPLPEGVSIFPGEVQTYLAVSPDGRKLAFVGGSLWIHSFEDGTSRLLSGTEGATLPFWSPDSSFIGFVSGGEIRKISADGGPARVICRSNQQAGISWGENGIVLFSQAMGGPPSIHAVSAEGGEPRAVTEIDPDKEVAHFWPQPLPDGDRFLFTALEKTGGGIERTLRAGSLSGGEVKLLSRLDSRVQYVPPGFLLYVIEGVVVAQRFDSERLELMGEPKPVADRLRYFLNTGQAEFSASLDPNRAVLASHGGSWLAELVWFDRMGNRTDRLDEGKAFGQPRISPSGTRLVVGIMDPKNGGRDLWVYELAGSAPRRFTLGTPDENNAVWSPDGMEIAFRSDVRGPPDIYRRPSGGSGEMEVLLSRPGVIHPLDWSKKGDLVFEEAARETGQDLWILPLVGERRARTFLDTPYQEWGARISSDGNWLAFASDESGRSEVYVAPIADPGARRPVSRAGGISPRWRKDGRELFFLGPDRTVVAVSIDAPSDFRVGSSKILFRLDQPVYNGAWDVTADGSRFLVNLLREDSRREPIRVVLNWTALLGE